MNIETEIIKVSLPHLLQNKQITVTYQAIDVCKQCINDHHPYLLCTDCQGVGFLSKVTTEQDIREEMKQFGALETESKTMFQSFFICKQCIGTGINVESKTNKICKSCQGMEIVSKSKQYTLLPSEIIGFENGVSTMEIKGQGNHQLGMEPSNLLIRIKCEYDTSLYEIDWKSGQITMNVQISALDSLSNNWSKTIIAPDGTTKLLLKGNKMAPLYFSNLGTWNIKQARGPLCVKPLVK